MAVTQNITYVDAAGTLKTTTVTIDVAKLAIGPSGVDEQIYLTVTAPGIANESVHRRNIDKLVEDAILASPSGTEHVTRYTGLSGSYSAYGELITASGSLTGVSGCNKGIKYQLINL